MKATVVCLLFLSLYVAGVFSVRGVDLSEPCAETAFRCMKTAGYDSAVIRVYQSNGRVDPNGHTTVEHSRAAGMTRTDVYMFPCHSCGDGGAQVRAAVDNLRSNNASYGTFWFDIEGPQYWSTDKASNSAFFEAMVTEAKSLDQHIGVYTSASQWDPIMGAYRGGASYPLWYAHYDGNPSFNDFAPFGGWTKPDMKQFRGTTTLCGCGVDLNYYA